MCLAQFWFSFFSGFTGQMMYFDYLFTLYNSLFTAIPVLMLSIFEQKYPEQVLMANPKLYPIPFVLIDFFDCPRYQFCVNSTNFNNPALFRWVLLGIYQSVTIFFIPFYAANHIYPGNGRAAGLWSEGNHIFRKVFN